MCLVSAVDCRENEAVMSNAKATRKRLPQTIFERALEDFDRLKHIEVTTSIFKAR